MTMRFTFLVVFSIALLTPVIFAESTDCSSPVLIVTDGRLTQSMFAPNSTYWYGVYAQAERSYTVEFVPAADNYFDPGHVQFSSISVFSTSDSLRGCRGTSTV